MPLDTFCVKNLTWYESKVTNISEDGTKVSVHFKMGKECGRMDTKIAIA